MSSQFIPNQLQQSTQQALKFSTIFNECQFWDISKLSEEMANIRKINSEGMTFTLNKIFNK